MTRSLGQDVRSFIGTWWLPDRPDEIAHGYLETNAEDVSPFKLTLDRELSDPSNEQPLWGQQLFGRSTAGDFTLDGAYPGTLTVNRHTELESEAWHAPRLIRGGHVVPDQVYVYARFQLPGLWFWFGPSKLNGYARERFRASKDDENPLVLRAELPGGVEVSLRPAFTETWDRATDSVEKYGVYTLHRSSGFTLEEIDRISLALQRLHACITDSPMGVFDLRLYRDDVDIGLRVLDPADAEGSVWAAKGLQDPFFDTAEIAFESFIPTWVDLHENAMQAVAAATPREDQQYLSSQLVELCNGFEALAVRILPKPELNDRDREILSALEAAGIRRAERNKVGTMLQRNHSTLESKLVGVAALLGEHSADWLLGGSSADWAHVTMRLRNAIAHGIQLPNGMTEDLPALIAATRTSEIVLRLAIFKQAGYQNPMSEHPGELLHAPNAHGASHKNSNLYRRVETVSNDSARWKLWRQRLKG